MVILALESGKLIFLIQGIQLGCERRSLNQSFYVKLILNGCIWRIASGLLQQQYEFTFPGVVYSCTLIAFPALFWTAGRKFVIFTQVGGSSSSVLVPCHLSEKFKACKAGKFQLYSCEIRHISLSISQKIEAQRRVMNYVRSWGDSGRPRGRMKVT